MVFYILLLLTLFLTAGLEYYFSKTNKSKIFLLVIKIFPFVLLFFINTFKSTNVGVDTKEYLKWYETLSAGATPGGSFPGLEIGFKLLITLFATSKLPFLVFYFFCNLLIYIPVAVVIIKLSKNSNFSALVYSCVGVLVLNFSGLRQAIAMSITFLALFFLIKRKIWSYIIFLSLVVFAGFFHKSGYVFLISLIFVPLKIKNLYLLYLIPFVILFFILIPDLFQFIYYSTGSTTYMPITRDGVGEYYFVFFTVFVLFYLLSSKNIVLDKLFYFLNKLLNKIKKTTNTIYFGDDSYANLDKNNTLFLWIFLAGVLFQATSKVSYVAPRFGTQFLMMASLFVPNILLSIKDKKTKIILSIGGAICFILFFIYDVLIPNYLGIIPYSLFF